MGGKTFSFEEILQKLVKLQLFCEFRADSENDRRILRLVYDEMVVREFRANDVIIREGDDGDLFYILASGRVKVYRNTMAGDQIALADLSAEAGIFFGETALIGTDKRGATVVAATDCRTSAITGKKFKELCEKEPILGYRVMLALAKRMSATIAKANSDMATLYEALFDEIVN